MSKTVKFRRDSHSDGSYLDHQRSDSGVGSFSSDNESRTAYGDRSPAGDYDTNLYSLLAAETSKKEQWMDKAHRLDELLIRAHKELKETQARLRGLEDHVEELKEEKTNLTKQNQLLTEKNQRLEEDLKELKESKDKDSKRASRRKSNSPPSMSGANPAASTSPVDEKSKPRRSASRRHSIGRERDDERIAIERERERERISQEMEKERRKEKEREKDEEMVRLRNRFNSRAAGEESDANSSKTSSKSKSSHRGSYVEPLGQPAPRPQVQVPPSPSTRHGQYPSYSGNGYATATDPRYAPSTVPRVPVVHPQVVVSYNDAFHDEEDGLYHAHPLPRGQRSPDRRERR